MEKFEIYQIGNRFYSNKKQAIELANKSFFGEIKSGKVVYSVYEVLYLLENKKAKLIKGKQAKRLEFEDFLKTVKINNTIYTVFRDLRNKGYVIKEGLKFGADFRVYERGENPKKSHAKYLLYTLESKQKMDLTDFCAKARVAHSTKKILLLAIVDFEGDVNYYEVQWKNKD